MNDPRLGRLKGGGPKLLKIKDTKYDTESMGFERHWEGSYINLIVKNMQSLSDQAFRDRLIGLVADHREKVTQGLIFGLLSDPENSQKYLECLGEIATDNWYSALCNMNMILFEFYSKMNDPTKHQILVFFRYAIKANVNKIDNVLMNYVRYATDGSDFNSRVKLARGVAELLMERTGQEWVKGLKHSSALMPLLLTIFIRIATDMQQGMATEAVRSLLLNAASFILQKRLADCLQLGRELIFVLMRVSRTPQFSPIWRDILKNPTAFGGAFKNVEDLLSRPSAPAFFSLRLSIPVLRQIDFMLSSLRVGNHDRHIEWFTEWNLRASDSSSLRSDIARYLISCSCERNMEMKVYLTHYMLIGCNPGVDLQCAKLGLWWDWFGFQLGESLQIIESTHNVLRYTLSVQPATANSWIEFAMKEMSNVYPPLAHVFKASFNNAYRALSERHGSGFVTGLLDNARLDSHIRELIRTELSSTKQQPPPVDKKANSVPLTKKEEKKSTPTVLPVKESTNRKRAASPIERKAKIKKKEKKSGMDDYMDTLRGELKKITKEVVDSFEDDKTENSEKCAAIERVMQLIQDNEEIQDDDNQLEALGQVLGHCLHPLVPVQGNDLLPEGNDNPSAEDLIETFDAPLYVIFRSLGGESRASIETVIASMKEKDKAVSYLLLFYLKVYSEDSSDTTVSSYENVAVHDSTLDESLQKDLECMAVDDRRLFSFLAPFIIKSFPNVVCNSPGIYRVICSYLDELLLTHLLGVVCREDLSLFKKDSFPSIFQSSLEWESVPQLMFWQLATVDGVSAEWLYPWYSRVNGSKHSIAASQLILLLKRQDPNTTLVRAVLGRQLVKDDLTLSLLKVIIEDEESCSRTGDIIGNILKKLLSTGEITVANTIVKGNAKKTNKLSMEHVLFHLNELAHSCMMKDKRMTEHLLTRDAFREALNTTRKHEKTKGLVKKFDTLYSLVALLEDEGRTSRSLRNNRGNTKVKRDDKNEADNKKKRKEVILIDSSDSD